MRTVRASARAAAVDRIIVAAIKNAAAKMRMVLLQTCCTFRIGTLVAGGRQLAVISYALLNGASAFTTAHRGARGSRAGNHRSASAACRAAALPGFGRHPQRRRPRSLRLTQ